MRLLNSSQSGTGHRGPKTGAQFGVRAGREGLVERAVCEVLGRSVPLLQGFFGLVTLLLSHCPSASLEVLESTLQPDQQGSRSLTWLGFSPGQDFCGCQSRASHGGVTVAGADGAVVIVLFSIHVLKQLKITLEMMAQSMRNVFLAWRKSPAALVATGLSWFCHVCSDWDCSLGWSCGMGNLSYLISSLLWHH